MTDDDPWDSRYDKSEGEESEETAEIAKSSKSSKSAESSETIRDRKNINMYLPESLVDDLQLRYSELNVTWRQEHGEDMPKNQEFYPAAIRAALNDTTIKEELSLDESV
jgi:hypothetical protein